MNADTQALVTINIDSLDYKVKAGTNLLEACLGLAKDLPYFCWHPAMGSVGSCRQCAVQVFQDQEDTRGRMAMACMTPVSEGMIISLNHQQAKQFRQQCIEVIMANHPHDCPVCEEGGECHLQDMTLQSGHALRRYKGAKKTYNNQDMGPCIGHEMNRCISCYRCVRFYQDYAGGDDLVTLGSRENVYFGRHEDGCLDSYFSGNLVEVCPTGVFYDKPFSNSFNRKWDLQSAPSICSHCSIGCNLSVGSRQGKVKRITNRYHGQINGYFLCDRGRYGYSYNNSEQRLTQCEVTPENSPMVSTDYAATLDYVGQIFTELGQQNVLALGSANASLEDNLALQSLVGKENFYGAVSAHQSHAQSRVTQQLQRATIHTPSLKQIEQADGIIILGEDLLHSAPRMALSVRQASRNLGLEQAAQVGIASWQDESVRIHTQDRRSPIICVTCGGSELADISALNLQLTPSQITSFTLALTSHLAGQPASHDLPAEVIALVHQAAELLAGAKRPLVISGTSSNQPALIDAAAELSLGLANMAQSQAWLSYSLSASNSMGLSLLQDEAHHLEQLQQRINSSPEPLALMVLQTDWLAFQDAAMATAMQQKLQHLIVIDQLPSATSRAADVVIACASLHESEGTLVNHEGRAQRYFAAYEPASLQPAWRSLANLTRWLTEQQPKTSTASQQALAQCQHFDDMSRLVSQLNTVFKHWDQVAPNADFRIAGMKIPRQSHRYSGRTSIYADIDVSERKQPLDEDSALAFTMEGSPVNPAAALIPQVWSPGWNSNEAINKFQAEIDGPLKGGDPGLRILDHQDTPPSTPANLPILMLNKGELLAVSQGRMFDSEPLSAMASALRQRCTSAVASIHPDTAAQFNLQEGHQVSICLGKSQWQLPVSFDSAMPLQSLLLPAQWHAPIHASRLPAAVTVKPTQQEAN